MHQRKTAWLLFVLVSCAPILLAQEGRSVREIRVEGAERLDRATILYYTTLQPGSTYDPAVAREDFRKLWDQGFFENLRLEVDEDVGVVDLIWHVVERPVLSSLRFQGNDGVLAEDIRSHLKDRGIEFREGAPFDVGQLERARVLMDELFRERGYRFAKVETEVVSSPDGDKAKAVTVRIDEGSKTRIASIDFEGNTAFDDGDLRKVLKKTKTRGFLCFMTKKCVFNEANFNEDLERLRDHYYDRGYLQLQVGEPTIEVVERGDKRELDIRIPVSEGLQYQVGKVDVAGAKAYPKELILALNRLKAGEPFSRKKMNESRKDITDIYGIRGYFNVVVVPKFDLQDDGTVDLTYDIAEDEPYYVHRISFRGNSSTKDKVIRRQMNLGEGDLFNTALFKRSLFRIYQLGYFSEPEPKIEEVPGDTHQLDITIDLQEQGRNDIRFGGGVSGVEGFFGTLAFSTRNLFGTGNSLTVDAQSGRRIKQYRLAYFDPFLFDRSISAGFDLFDRETDFIDFEQRGRGGEFQLGYRLGDFWFLQTAYRYEEVRQRAIDQFDVNGNRIPFTPEEFDLYTDDRRVSSLLPSLVFSTVDNPVRPWRGFRSVFAFEYTGGFLGGTTNLVKPRVDATFYLPLSRRIGLAVHGEASYVSGFGDDADNVPLFEKFFLGGERSLRGYEAFQVGPRDVDSNGNDILIGGDKMMVFNTELQFRIADPVSLVLFADAGNAFREGDSLGFGNLEKSFGAEVRFWTPLLQAPLRLIYSYVPEPLIINGVEQPQTDFTFSIGTTF